MFRKSNYLMGEVTSMSDFELTGALREAFRRGDHILVMEAESRLQARRRELESLKIRNNELENECEMLKKALAAYRAIRSQPEPEKGGCRPMMEKKLCPICTGKNGEPHLEKDWIIGIDGNANGHPGHSWALHANYCPGCGRELKESEARKHLKRLEDMRDDWYEKASHRVNNNSEGLKAFYDMAEKSAEALDWAIAVIRKHEATV